MGHTMDRDDALGRELGLCNDAHHIIASLGCTVATANDLADKIADARRLLADVATLADEAIAQWDAATEYPEDADYRSVAERVKLAQVARTARILATDNTEA